MYNLVFSRHRGSHPYRRLAGAVLVVGATAYERREENGQWMDSCADAVVDGASSVVKGARRVLGSIF